MSVEIKRKDNETVGAMLRRFTRSIQQSGVLIRARKMRFVEDVKTKREIKESAIYRTKKQKEEAKLIKLGKITVKEPFKRRR